MRYGAAGTTQNYVGRNSFFVTPHERVAVASGHQKVDAPSLCKLEELMRRFPFKDMRLDLAISPPSQSRSEVQKAGLDLLLLESGLQHLRHVRRPGEVGVREARLHQPLLQLDLTVAPHHRRFAALPLDVHQRQQPLRDLQGQRRVLGAEQAGIRHAVGAPERAQAAQRLSGGFEVETPVHRIIPRT